MVTTLDIYVKLCSTQEPNPAMQSLEFFNANFHPKYCCVSEMNGGMNLQGETEGSPPSTAAY